MKSRKGGGQKVEREKSKLKTTTKTKTMMHRLNGLRTYF